MKKLLTASFALLLMSIIGLPQRAKVSQMPIPAQIEIDDDAIPSTKDLTVYLNFGADGAASIEVKGNDGNRNLTSAELASFLQKFSATRVAKPTAAKAIQLRPIYVIRPDLSLSLSAIMDSVNSVRTDSANNITIDLGDDALLYVRKKDRVSRSVKPNPLFLLIDISADSKITLNREDQGSMSDLSKLKGFLSKIFGQRTENGVYRGTSNTVDTTINIRVPPSIKFDVLKRMVSAVASAGSDRIFLNVDSEEPIRSVLISNIDPTPVKK